MKDYLAPEAISSEAGGVNELVNHDINSKVGTDDANDYSRPLSRWVSPILSDNPVTDPAKPQPLNRRL